MIPVSLRDVLFICFAIALQQTNAARARAPETKSRLERRYEHHEVQLDENKHDEEFFTFVTRPDIDAPKWDIEVFEDESVTPGYWFSAPYSDVRQLGHDGPWNGPHIYDSNGDLVWSGAPMFSGWSTFDFRVINVLGKPMLSLIHQEERRAVILDDTYQIHKIIELGTTADLRENEVGVNMHEFTTVDDGTKALYFVRLPRKASRDISASAGFDGECYVVFHGIREMNTQTWDIIHEWTSEDHIGLNESYVTQVPIDERCTDERPWDFLHPNSIDTFPNGDYLVSGRRTYAIYRISRETGAVVWRLGGRESDFEAPFIFAGQHAARIIETSETHTTISFLDNAFGPGDPPVTNNMSRGLIVQLDTKAMKAEIIAEFLHPLASFATGRGNMQVLPNGNAWLCWTENSLQSEHSPDGSLLMKAGFKANLASYRTYKYPWTGLPSYPPDVQANLIKQNESWFTYVYMSWNGATEIRNWKVYNATADEGENDMIAEVPKQGFETTIRIEGYAGHVVVEALNKDGNSLGRSKVVASVQPTNRIWRILFISGIILGVLISIFAWATWMWLWPRRDGTGLSWWRRPTHTYKLVATKNDEQDGETKAEGVVDEDKP